MRRTYSVYEAKARLSEIIRLVRERGESVLVSYHGRPVAEIRPIEAPQDETPVERRIRELTERGAVSPADGRRFDAGPIVKRPGALRRFLEDRD
jgi:prevent-host-death family protein